MIKKLYKKIVKKLSIFDYFIIVSFLFFATIFFIFFFRQKKYITVEIKVTEKNVLYSTTAPQSWFTYLFQNGMIEKDGLGRISAEILDVYSYDYSYYPYSNLNYTSNTKATYLTLRLKTTYSKKNNLYKYKGTPISVGEGIRINFERILVEGLITNVEGIENNYSEKELFVDCQLIDNNPIFAETTGVHPFIADAINVGDKVYDSKRNTMAEILRITVNPAKKNVVDINGNVYTRYDPQMKDVILSLKIKVKGIDNEYYFFDDNRVKVNNALPLHFQNISIFPIITKIEIL